MRQSIWAKKVPPHSLSTFRPILVLLPLCLALKAERTEMGPMFQLVEFRSVVTCLFLVPQQWAIFSSNGGGEVMREAKWTDLVCQAHFYSLKWLVFRHHDWRKWSACVSVSVSLCEQWSVCMCISEHSSVHMQTYTRSLEKPVKPAGSAQFDPKQTREEFGSEWSIRSTRTY